MSRASMVPHLSLMGALFLCVGCGASTPEEPSPSPSPSGTADGGGPPPGQVGDQDASQDAAKPDTSPPPPKCGATEAKKCAVGVGCSVDRDCETGNCVSKICAAASCTNTKLDGDELGVDCGGSLCKKCDGADCLADPECTSEICFQRKCAPPGTKTCGVGLPDLCVDGKRCQTDTDCASDVCDAARCVPVTPAAHSDGRRNAGETGVDCGGSIKATRVCLQGQGCVDVTDCESTICDATRKCGASTHVDGKLSPSIGETDVDCGGTMPDSLGNPALKCASTKTCKVADDCDSGRCTAGVCEPRMAGRRDGDESDVDCGGTVPDPDTGLPTPRCEDAKLCGAGGDCASTFCFQNRCIGGQSCATADTPGITTCGRRESNSPTRIHESCCRALQVPGLGIRMGKYEVTAGRMRQFITAVGPNIRGWVAGEIAAGTPIGNRLALQIPANVLDLLPASAAPNQPLNLIVQLGAGVMDKRNPSMRQGCYNGPNSYGHSTYWQPVATLRSLFGMSFPARRFTQAQYDEKPMNCSPYWMYAAFCAWDGGRLPTRAEFGQVWGPGAYPWGATRYPTDGVTNYETTVNWGNSIPGDTPPPVLFYHYPAYAGTGNAADSTGYIAGPGRFPLDLTALRTDDDEGWMDIGANLMEMAQTDGTGSSNFCDFSVRAAGEALSPTCSYTEDGVTTQGVLRRTTGIPGTVWQGGSWEGHGSFSLNAPVPFRREWYGAFAVTTQYGKTGFRCAYDP